MNELTKSALSKSKIPKDILTFMKEPKAVVKVNFPIKLDGRADIETITGVRVIHSNHALPTKGGLRFSVTTTQEDLEALASLMSYKASLHHIPFGGAKGCIFIDPKKYTYDDKVKIVRRYTIEMWKRSMINPAVDVMNPDHGTDEKMMNIIKETYKSVLATSEVNIDAVVTGKGLAFGGIGPSKMAAGYGVAHAAKFIRDNLTNKILKTSKLDIGGSKKSVIVQGFGVVGLNMAKSLVKDDFKIIGMTDEDTGCFNQIGFDPEEIYNYKKKNNGLQGVSKTLNDPHEVLTQKCDILVATQKELAFDAKLAKSVKCKMLIEGTNSPCTKEALDILKERQILVIPDLLSYSGGFIVSYLEWLKNLEHRNLTLLFKRFESNSRKTMFNLLQTSEIGVQKTTFKGPEEDELVLMTIEEMMDNSFMEVLKEAEEFDMDLKCASLKIAIERIYNKYKSQPGINMD
jgi:glutamate dehydrogenase (NAD(P)+)